MRRRKSARTSRTPRYTEQDAATLTAQTADANGSGRFPYQPNKYDLMPDDEFERRLKAAYDDMQTVWDRFNAPFNDAPTENHPQERQELEARYAQLQSLAHELSLSSVRRQWKRDKGDWPYFLDGLDPQTH